MATHRAAWWWIDRWRKSTAYTDMTAEQQGVYRNLLDELWLRDGILPAEERILSKVSGDADAWLRVRDVVLARFHQTPAGYRNDTHDEVSSWPASQAAKGRKRAAGAARVKGRFTSSPAQPAHDQPRPPAQHQPPSPSPSPSSEEKDFIEFWKLYPKRVDKPAALKAWLKLPDADRLACLKTLRNGYRFPADKQYTKNPSGFLNGRRWEDEQHSGESSGPRPAYLRPVNP